ncbi:hypothetical protein [Haloarcula argentinensis]|uniref:hypothetical protein n=1 Tax=Haloarcula argentinensis TaxID=43776 RepID=UPI0002B255D0|nr:hypothetical protein [Haloarcula argentinensis]EMA18993.1 hypothetical protein C443_17823 [Haloarcula argentinensis DSM 12282]
MSVQYGDGLVDHTHVELTPLSTAAVGIYVPVPRTEKLCLVQWSRAGGVDIDLRHVGGDDDGE